MSNINRNLKKIISQPYSFDIVESNNEKAIKKFGKDYIVDFGIGDPADSTPEIMRDSCKRAVDERKDQGYPESIGHKRFRAAVCEWMKKRFNVNLSEDEVIATYGAKYACFHIPLLFVNPNNDEIVLIPNPGYPPYTEGTTLAGARSYYLNILEDNNFEPDLTKIKSSEAEKAKVFFLNSPHSPTGKSYSKEKLKEIVDFCIDNNIILVSDECYSELYFGEKPLSILQIDNADQCSIVLNSLSKRSMMTGYSVGFFASKNEELLKAFKTLQQKSVQGVATFIQDAAVTAFSDEKHCEEMRKVYSERIDAMIPALRAVGCKVSKPDGTFYLWAKLPMNKDPINFSESLLLNKGINSVPGNLISYTFNGINPGVEYVRFAMVQPIEKVKEAAERLSGGK